MAPALNSIGVKPAMDTGKDRLQLLKSLRGQSVCIPDLEALLEHWPRSVNPELSCLRQDVERTLESLFPEGERLRKMRMANIALFAASWWPYASYERLRLAAYLSIWLFAWDDETDSAEFSSLVSSLDAAQDFRRETIEYVQQCLGGKGFQEDGTQPSSTIIKFFKTFGPAISDSFSHEQNQTFLNEILYFVAMTNIEQEYQTIGTLPTVHEYKQRRMGSSAVGVCLAISEFTIGIEIPQKIMAEEDMKVLWNETNVIISTVNDILSFKKEFRQNQVDTLIPLLYLQYGSLEASMASAAEMVKDAVAAFDVSAQRLLDRHVDDNEILPGLRGFIHGCRLACTANLSWSLVSGRYKLGSHSLSGGIEVVL